uniref:Carbonic anhydrase n=1 Tax=Ditylenchus dipsaci TaxID=166011 RepID=A0A915CVV5_9BILA
MTKPGPVSTLFTKFWASLFKKSQVENRTYIGKDHLGNRFYEIKDSKTNVTRGYDPPGGQDYFAGRQWVLPSVEWRGWLNGSRKTPPSDQEIFFNQNKQQAQLKEDAVTEKRAPLVGSSGKGAADVDRKRTYPSYDEAEVTPGLPPARNTLNGRIKKVLDGILLFRKTVRKDLVTQFEKVRDNPNPTAVMFTCMDSRVLPARFTQAQVGDMFVVRNSGNMIPNAQNYGMSGYEVSVTTEPAALELAVKRGKIRHVVFVDTLTARRSTPYSPMDHWLRRHGHQSIKKLELLGELEQGVKQGKAVTLDFSSENSLLSFSAQIDPDDCYNIEDKLSQINTLQQVTNIASHGFLREFLEQGTVHLHAFWFDIYTGNMHMFSRTRQRFVLIDEESVPQLLEEDARQPLNSLASKSHKPADNGQNS